MIVGKALPFVNNYVNHLITDVTRSASLIEVAAVISSRARNLN
jgi:hypothetical protein